MIGSFEDHIQSVLSRYREDDEKIQIVLQMYSGALLTDYSTYTYDVKKIDKKEKELIEERKIYIIHMLLQLCKHDFNKMNNVFNILKNIDNMLKY